MKQSTFWARIFLVGMSAFMIGYLVNKIAPSQDSFMWISILLVLYVWIICNLYTRFFVSKINFEKYQGVVAIVHAIFWLVILLLDRSELTDSLLQILLFFFFYSNGILSLFGESFNLLKARN